jgi:hypothetical protein
VHLVWASRAGFGQPCKLIGSRSSRSRVGRAGSNNPITCSAIARLPAAENECIAFPLPAASAAGFAGSSRLGYHTRSAGSARVPGAFRRWPRPERTVGRLRMRVLIDSFAAWMGRGCRAPGRCNLHRDRR